MDLRPATLADVPALARLGRDSFVAKFGHLYRQEDLDAFLEMVFSDAAVAEEVAGDVCIHRLAWAGDQLAGYCKLRRLHNYPEHSDALNPVELGQLYTDPAMTGQGIGAELMQWAMAEARAGGHDAIQLTVWSENFGAQKFYARYGFAKIADIDFWVGNHRDDEFLYELRLT
jgi:ribosomal protein S18 acetylase RimI-like enzyme